MRRPRELRGSDLCALLAYLKFFERVPTRAFDDRTILQVIGRMMRRAGGSHTVDLRDGVLLVRTGLGVGLKLSLLRLCEDYSVDDDAGAYGNDRCRDFRGWF